MMVRVNCPNLKRAKDYVGRGIGVCEEWREFESFMRDMGERPLGMTLDRIDNDAGYSKENCRWATPKQQMNNTRRNRYVTFRGETNTVAQWAEALSIPEAILRSRLARGWSVDDAMTRPVVSRTAKQLREGRV